MLPANVPEIVLENIVLRSGFLQRNVSVDLYIPDHEPVSEHFHLLLVNDGQNLEELGLAAMLRDLFSQREIGPLLCVGLHASLERKMEYGIAAQSDYMGRGALAGSYTSFIFRELLPLIYYRFGVSGFREKSFAGFSLGGLMALDIVWNHPHEFRRAGVFSGSLWWRSKALDDGYVEELDRIMHQEIRRGQHHPHLKFYFTTGSLDETADRNNNGIIDSIDDTLTLIDELELKGYHPERDIVYRNFEDGKHDIETWARAMPDFLRWGWGQYNS